MTFLSEFLAHSGHPVCTSPDPQAKAIIGCHSPLAPYPQSLQTRYTCFALPEVTRVGGNSLSVGCHCAAISGCTVATSLTPSTRTFPEHAGHPPPVRQAPAIEGRHSPFFQYPHFGQIRASLRLLPQVTSSGDTELAVGCHIAATRGHSSATVPRCLRYRHSKSFTVQLPPPVYGCFRTLRYLQLCCRRYHIYPQGHADFCRYSSVQIPQIPGFGLLHYP